MIVKIRNHLRKNEIIEIMKMVDEDKQEITRDFLYSEGYEVEKNEDFYKSWLAYLKERKFFKIKHKTACHLYEIENTNSIPKTEKDKLRAERKKRNRIKNFEYIRDLLKKEGFIGETFEEVEENLSLYQRTGKRLCPPFKRYHVGFLPIFDSGIEIKKNKKFSEKFSFQVKLSDDGDSIYYDYSKPYVVYPLPYTYYGLEDFNWCHTGDEKKLIGLTCQAPYGFLIRVHYDYRPSLYIYRTWSGIGTCNGVGFGESSDEF
jgi:hypothetical protein